MIYLILVYWFIFFNASKYLYSNIIKAIRKFFKYFDIFDPNTFFKNLIIIKNELYAFIRIFKGYFINIRSFSQQFFVSRAKIYRLQRTFLHTSLIYFLSKTNFYIHNYSKIFYHKAPLRNGSYKKELFHFL